MLVLESVTPVRFLVEYPRIQSGTVLTMIFRSLHENVTDTCGELMPQRTEPNDSVFSVTG